jgi:hypothetical protein
MSTPVRRTRLQKPDPPRHDSNTNRWIYKDQQLNDEEVRFTAEQFAELLYLRDLTLYYQQELRGYMAWERSINEALNTGDGSYRP